MARRKPGEGRRGNRRTRDLDRDYLAAIGQVKGEAEGAEGGGEPPGPGAGLERYTFGKANLANLVLEVPDDALTAVITELTFGSDASLGPQDIAGVLIDQAGLSEPLLDRDRIDQLGRRAANAPSSTVRLDIVVAQGRPPVPGEPARVEYPYLRGAAAPPPGAAAELRAALAGTDLQQVLAAGPASQLVSPGEELTRSVPAAGGAPGRDVRGHLLSLDEATSAPRAGPGAEQRGNATVATRYGYAVVDEQGAAVLSPVWLSPDHMEAHFLHFPQLRPADKPQSQWITQLLEALEVRTGIEEANLERLCRFDVEPEARETFLLAAGKPAVNGADTHLDFAIDLEKRAGHILPDGSIDLRERNAAVGASAGQLIATLVPHSAGETGSDLTGQELPATDGEEREFTAGDNVKSETADGQIKFVSEIDGAVSFKGDTLSVNAAHAISGDVNYDTGNIDVEGDVQISGSVGSGFTIKAGGTVTVGGTIEPGAEVRARGDVVAARGILGDTTTVVALGNVETKFIQGASVMAQADVVVGSYIFNAQVRAGGLVQLGSGGSGRAGSIVGGEVVASKGVEARLLGSPSTDVTVVGIGADPETAGRLAKARKAVRFCDTHIARIQRTLGLDSPDPAGLENLVRRAPQARREQLLELIKKLKELIESREKAQTTTDELAQQVAEALSQATVRATEMAYAGVQVSFADDVWDVAEDTAKPVFHMTDEGLKFRSA